MEPTFQNDYLPADEFQILMDWAVKLFQTKTWPPRSDDGWRYRDTIFLYQLEYSNYDNVRSRCPSVNGTKEVMLNIYGPFHDIPWHYDDSTGFVKRIVVLNLWGASRFFYSPEHNLSESLLYDRSPRDVKYVDFLGPNQAFVMPGDYLHMVHTETERASLIYRYF